MTADVAGPFRAGRDQDGNGKKYMFVAAYTVPTTEDTPLAKGLRELGGLPPLEEQRHHEELNSDGAIPYEVDGVGDKDNILDEESAPQEDVQPEEVPQQEPGEHEERDPLAEFPEEPTPLTPVEIQECDLADQEWKEKIANLKNVKVQTLTFAIPIRSRHATEIVAAMSEVYTRLRSSMALPVMRFHSDRAKEFISHPVKRCLSNRSILRTTTAADEPQGSGRAEAEVQNLKSQVRLALKASSSPDELWPLALRHVAEARCRAQLLGMGIRLPRLLPFGVKALARSKLWHKRQQAWQYPMQEVTIYGPALGMSASSKGYFLKAGNRWLRSTVVIIPKEVQLPEPQLPVHVAAQETSPDDYEPTTPGGEAVDVEEMILEEAHHQHPSPGADIEVPDMDSVGQLGVRRRVYGKTAPKRRLHGKTKPAPVLRILRTGGEWSDMAEYDKEMLKDGTVGWLEGLEYLYDTEDEEVAEDDDVIDEQEDSEYDDEIEDDYEEVENFVIENGIIKEEEKMLDEKERKLKRSMEWRRQRDDRRAVMLLQHRELGQLSKEEKQLSDHLQIGKVVNEIEGRRRSLERALKTMQIQEEECECLAPRTVMMDEVRRDMELRREPIKKEYDSLIQHGAIQPITRSEMEDMKNNYQVEVVPGKLVAVMKPPGKRKARLVACGNIACQQSDNISAGGLDTIAIRTMICEAAQQRWCLATCDVKTAFLQAPRREGDGKVTIITPPGVAKGVLRHGEEERWVVSGALYGLVESPHDWSVHRDKKMRNLRWRFNGANFYLQLTEEANLWKIVKEEKQGTGKTVGYVGVYVDDLMFASTRETVESAIAALGKVFQLAPEEYVNVNDPVTFCGYEIKETEEGFSLGQQKYIREMLKKHDISRSDVCPAPKIEEAEKEEEYELSDLRLAQGLTGELSWVASRSRPDLAFAVGLMSRLIHKRPKFVAKIGFQAMRYLHGSIDLVLNYKKSAEEDLRDLKTYVDASFGLAHEGFRSVQGILQSFGGNPLAWASTRQPFIAQSTAESELPAYNESLQTTEALLALMKVFERDVAGGLYGDSKSAISQLTLDTGSWRTRHLYVCGRRSYGKLYRTRRGGGCNMFVQGTTLVADGLTKPLQGQSFLRFRQMLGLVNPSQVGETTKLAKLEIHQRDNGAWRDIAHGLLGGGLALFVKGDSKLGCLLLLAAAGMLKCQGREGTQDRKKDDDKTAKESKQKREGPKPPSDESWSGTAKEGVTGTANSCFTGMWKCQGDEDIQDRKKDDDKTAEESKKKGKGPKPPNEESWSGTAEEGVTGTANRCFGEKASVNLGGRGPGLRAFRMSSGGKDGRKDGTQETSYVGGRATSQEGGTPYGEQQSAGSSMGYAKGGATSRGAAAMQMVVPPRTQSVQVTADLQVSVKVMDEAGGTTTRSQINQGEGQEGESSRSPDDSMEPWKLSRFDQIRAGSSDVWILDYLRHGWLVREHRHVRKMGYHPVHRHLPVPHESILHERTTVQHYEEGGVRIIKDDWRNPLRFDGRLWRGYTFIRVSRATMTAAVGSGSDPAAEHAEEGNDEGFEFVNS